jgi:hypothetical protein
MIWGLPASCTCPMPCEARPGVFHILLQARPRQVCRCEHMIEFNFDKKVMRRTPTCHTYCFRFASDLCRTASMIWGHAASYTCAMFWMRTPACSTFSCRRGPACCTAVTLLFDNQRSTRSTTGSRGAHRRVQRPTAHAPRLSSAVSCMIWRR